VYVIRNLDFVVMFDNILDGDDGIGSVGERAAGRDRHRLARAKLAGGRPPGGNACDNGKPTRSVGCANGEAVHCRRVERREVDLAHGLFGQHAPGGLRQRDALYGQAADALEDPALRLLD
jgi:hypothetical protein